MKVMRKNYVLGDSIGNIKLDYSNRGVERVSSKFNISTYGQMLAIPAWKIRDSFDNWYDYALVRDDAHSKGYNLLGENVMLGLLDDSSYEEIADKKISDCCLSAGLKSCLLSGSNRSHPIATIGDLLIVPYDDFRKIRNLGETRLLELQEFVQGLGTVFYKYKVPVEKIPDILRKNGVIPIEDIDLDADMLAILHNRGMHSVGDVLAKLEGITKMSGFGETRSLVLHNKLADVDKESLGICPSKEVLEEAWDPNHLEKKLRKTQIENCTEYNRLLLTRKELERRLSYVDSRIRYLEAFGANTDSKSPSVKQYAYKSKK